MTIDSAKMPVPLPEGIRSRIVPQVNGLDMHVLEANFERENHPLVLLLHGFPELSFSWRKLILPLSKLGFHVVAPDQRGYGRTRGWSGNYDDPLLPFSLLNLTEDMVQLVQHLGHERVHCVVGHDFGSPVAACCALTQPEIFQSVIMMSAPFGGPPETATAPIKKQAAMDGALSQLSPPRKHYQTYYTTREANRNMHMPEGGLAAFLRAYYHYKSADYKENQPHPLNGWLADELAQMPTYYIMEEGIGMAETVAPHLPNPEEVSNCDWLTETELRYYAQEFDRTGFQGGLQWYRCSYDEESLSALSQHHGKKITVPSGYIAGAQDWGIYQVPGAFEAMQEKFCSKMKVCTLIKGAGHWVQQEKPTETFEILRDFLADLPRPQVACI